MTDEENQPKQGTKRRAVVISVIVAVVLLAGAAGVLVRMKQDSDSSTTAQPPPLPESVQDTEELLAGGDLAGAETLVNDRLNDPSISDAERYQLYVKQGAIAYEKQDYQTALEAYLKAFAVDENADMASKIGATYQQLGDKQKAIEYYNKAITLNEQHPEANPTWDADNNTLRQMIAMLESGQ